MAVGDVVVVSVAGAVVVVSVAGAVAVASVAGAVVVVSVAGAVVVVSVAGGVAVPEGAVTGGSVGAVSDGATASAGVVTKLAVPAGSAVPAGAESAVLVLPGAVSCPMTVVPCPAEGRAGLAVVGAPLGTGAADDEVTGVIGRPGVTGSCTGALLVGFNTPPGTLPAEICSPGYLAACVLAIAAPAETPQNATTVAAAAPTV